MPRLGDWGLFPVVQKMSSPGHPSHLGPATRKGLILSQAEKPCAEGASSVEPSRSRCDERGKEATHSQVRGQRPSPYCIYSRRRDGSKACRSTAPRFSLRACLAR
jgi:hypothetical protein